MRITRCRRYHAFTDANTYTDRVGKHHCRLCHRQRERLRRAANRRARVALPQVYDLVAQLRRTKQLHVHWVRVSGQWNWKIVKRSSQLCANPERCLPIPLRIA